MKHEETPDPDPGSAAVYDFPKNGERRGRAAGSGPGGAVAWASDHVQRLNDDKSLLDQSGNINQDYNQAPVARDRHFSYQGSHFSFPSM